jgi:hypothetical protein
MELYIEKWFLEDTPLYNIKTGDEVSVLKQNDIFKKMILSGDKDYGFYYAKNGFRVGFSDNYIDEIGIDFTKSKCKVIFKTNESLFNFREKKIHKVLDFLNDNLLSWKAVESLDNNHLMIKLNKNGIMIIFDVYKGTITNIVKSNLMSV